MKEKMKCKTDGCDNNIHARGYCPSCYRKYVARADTRPRCTHEAGCDKPAEAREMCSTHYALWRRTNHRNDIRPCTINGCGLPFYSKELCSKHYCQARLYNLDAVGLQTLLSGGCSINGCDSVEGLVIDHDHGCCHNTPTCGVCTRGALCTNHNIAIGHLHNNPDEADAVAAYLRQSTD
jgi:hypothetical protein